MGYLGLLLSLCSFVGFGVDYELLFAALGWFCCWFVGLFVVLLYVVVCGDFVVRVWLFAGFVIVVTFLVIIVDYMVCCFVCLLFFVVCVVFAAVAFCLLLIVLV